MDINTLLDGLPVTLIAGAGGIEKLIDGCFVGDVMSLALARAKEHDMWITMQGHVNVVAVAVMVGISAIILTDGIIPSQAMCERAEQENIPLLTTHLGSYEMAVEVSKLFE